jgi:hypothetical protein
LLHPEIGSVDEWMKVTVGRLLLMMGKAVAIKTKGVAPGVMMKKTMARALEAMVRMVGEKVMRLHHAIEREEISQPRAAAYVCAYPFCFSCYFCHHGNF